MRRRSAIALMLLPTVGCSPIDPDAESGRDELTAPAPARAIVGPLSVSQGHITDVGGAGWVRISSAGYGGMAEPDAGTWLTPDEAGGECSPEPCTTETLYDAHRRVGFNAVRLLVSWTNLEPKSPWTAFAGSAHKADANDPRYWDPAYEAALRDVVHKYNQAGVAVILGFHPYNREQFWGPHPKNAAFPWWFYQKLGPDKPFTDEQDKDPLNCSFLTDDPGGPSVDYYMNVNLTDRRPYVHLAEALKRFVKILPRSGSYPDGGYNVVGFDLWNEPFVTNDCARAHPGFRRAFISAMGNAIGSERRPPPANDQLLIIAEEVWRGDVRSGHWEMSGSAPAFQNANMKFVWSWHFYPNRFLGDARDQIENAVAHAADLDHAPIYIGESDPRTCGQDATLAFTGYGSGGADWYNDGSKAFYQKYVTERPDPDSMALLNDPDNHISLGITRLTGNMHSILKKTGATFADCGSNERTIDPSHVPDALWLSQVATTFTH